MVKKGVVAIIAVLLSLNYVFAAQGEEGITRITAFETDNIHILRLQNFSRAVVEEVADLKLQLNEMQQQLATIQMQLGELKKEPSQDNRQEFSSNVNSITAQLVGIESEINNLKENKKAPQETQPLQFIFILNALIFVFTVVLLFFVSKNNSPNEKKIAEVHAQLHLNNAVKNAIKSGINVDKIRQTFVMQGWNEQRVEKALQESVKL